MTNEEALEILKPLFDQCKGTDNCLGYIEHYFSKNEEKALDLAIRALEERPQGEWIYDSEHSITIDIYKCSLCNCFGHTHLKFCPNCGAKMRRVKHEQ